MTHLDDLPLYEEAGRLTQIIARYEESRKTLWIFMRAFPRPCFNPTLLEELSRLGQSLTTGRLPVNFWVLGSAMPGFFNTGGDLSLFQEKILSTDIRSLTEYARACVALVHGAMTGFGTPTITIAMIEGSALGGGFEAGLAHQFVLAQKGTKLGFPEVAFNLFPGMGAYSIVHRKAGPAIAQELMIYGESHFAEWHQHRGLVDQVFEQGEAVRAVRTFIDHLTPKLNGVRGTLAARQRVAGISLQELLDVTHTWVGHAMSLEPKDLSYMARLVNVQSKVNRASIAA